MNRRPPKSRSQPALYRFPGLLKLLGLFFGALAAGAIILGVASVLDDDDSDGATRPDPDAATLRLGVVGLSSLDPIDARDPASVMVADQIFDTLVTYDQKTSEPKPQLAASWEVNPEQTVFTFRLREATFHDSSPVTAADVKFTLERIAAAKDSASPLSTQLEAVTGFAAFVDGSAPELAGLEAPEALTLIVRLDRPFAPFPSTLGHPGFGVVPRAVVEATGEGFKTAPVGSGPFMFGSDADGRLRLNRFADRKPVARIERIDVLRHDGNDDAYAAFVDGRLDVAPVPPGKVAQAAAEYGPRGMRPVGVLFYGLNLKSPNLADARFREAIGLAVNRDKILRRVYSDALEPATALTVAGVPGYAADTCGSRCDYDPERAKALIAEAFPAGDVPEIHIDHEDDPSQVDVATLLQADLKAVGITAVLRPHPFADYDTFIVSGGQEMFRYGWVGAYPSLDAVLAPLFASGSPENLSGVSDPDVDAGLTAARAETDPKTRVEIYRRVTREVLNQFAVVLLAELETRMVVAERVESFLLNPLGTFDGAAVRLAVE